MSAGTCPPPFYAQGATWTQGGTAEVAVRLSIGACIHRLCYPPSRSLPRLKREGKAK